MKQILWISFCLFTLSLNGVTGTIIQSPMNEATSVGGRIFFNCTSNANWMMWLYTTDCDVVTGSQLTGSNCEVTVNYSTHYRTEKPGGFICNLIVSDALLFHGGCYVCTDGFGAGGFSYAYLIIVDNNTNLIPNTTDFINGEDVSVSTSVSYRGPIIPPQPLPPLSPSFYWTRQSSPSQNITSNQELTNTSASSYIVDTVQKPVVPQYLCNMFFNPPVNVPQYHAANAPTYRTSWTTPTYNVAYGPENIQVTGVPDPCLDQPVKLTCSASGYPTPTCTWYNVTANDVVLSETCVVTIESAGHYQCNTSNTIRNQIYTVSSQEFVIIDCAFYVGPTSDTCDTTCIIILVVVIYFGLNLLFFTIFMICYGCSKTGRNTMNDRFSWLKKMLPCVNGEGCKCSMWIFGLVLLSIFVAMFFFPVILIMAGCCKKKKKTSQANAQQNERNGRGNPQPKPSGPPPIPLYQSPARVSITPNPPSSLDLSGSSHLGPTSRRYPQSSPLDHQPTYSDPYPRHLNLPRQTPSPVSTGGVVYAELGVDNQPRSRLPIQPIQEASAYADIAIA